MVKNSDIIPINNKEMVVTDDKKLARSFNHNYINIFEWPSGLKSEKIELDNSINTNKKVLESIVSCYKNQRYIPKLFCKYFAFNFRPVTLLNCFSKIYENHIKNQSVHSISNHMFRFVSANRKGYNSQHL